MKPEIKQKWLNALRNGEYSQGRYQLRDDNNNFCCLGVLTDLYLKETNQEWIEGEEQFAYLPPESVVEWAELPCGNPSIMIEGANTEVVISDLNDYYNYSFDQIADLIESQL